MKKSRLSGQSTYPKAMMKLYGHMVLLMTWDLPALAHGHIPGADAPYPRKSARPLGFARAGARTHPWR